MRILCIDPQANGLDWLMRCQAHGHLVKWYVPDKPRLRPIGLGLIDKVKDWQGWVRWADMIFCTDNTTCMKELDAIRRQGGPVIIGATDATSDWELDRDLGMRMFRKKGIDVPPCKSFTDYDAAIAYVKREDRAFVSKPSGDADKALSYVGKTPEDLVYMLERWKKLGKLKSPFILQEKVSGQEMAVGGWFGPGGFASGWCENWEFKKLCDGDRGPNCFPPDAEVLTRAGWKKWQDVTLADEFCTLKGGQITYDPPIQIVQGWFDGELVGWKSETVDILVTPGHQMYVQDDHARRPFFFEDAADTAVGKRLIMRGGGSWQGADTGMSPEMAELTPDISYRERYTGKVYCCTVPSHVIYVRQNGKACWIGQTGEQGTILRYVSKSKLAARVLKPFDPDLVAAGYLGYIDVNCIIDEKGTPWPLEFTMRPGWPTFNIQQALHGGDPADWLMDLAHGKKIDAWELDTVACGVVLSIPDYPFNKFPVEDVCGIPIYGLKPGMMANVHPCEMALGTAPQRSTEGHIETAPIMVTAGTYILVGSGTGSTVEEARRHAYQILDRVSLPNSPMYRTDIGRRLQWELPKVFEHGYASGLIYSD